MGSVTISASYGAHGDRIGHEVAERLGLALLDRAIPAAVARQLRLPDDAAQSLDRAPARPGERGHAGLTRTRSPAGARQRV